MDEWCLPSPASNFGPCFTPPLTPKCSRCLHSSRQSWRCPPNAVSYLSCVVRLQQGFSRPSVGLQQAFSRAHDSSRQHWAGLYHEPEAWFAPNLEQGSLRADLQNVVCATSQNISKCFLNVVFHLPPFLDCRQRTNSTRELH